jgi:hypothetical protein
MANGTYAPDGSLRGIDTDVQNGLKDGDGATRMTVATTEWGVQAPDGSLYIEKIANGTTGNGTYNGRGNLRVVRAEVVTGNGLKAPNGATRVTGLSA